MKEFFTIGEIAKQQNISRQALIFYDKMGVFCPAYTDNANGYRYYSAKQLDYLDTICIMRRIGFSLEEIKAHMKNYTIENSIVALRRQLSEIEKQISELQMIKSRVEKRCVQLESAIATRGSSDAVVLEKAKKQHVLLHKVAAPHGLDDVSIATKECFARSFKEGLPIFFQSGAIVPRERIMQGRYTEAEYVFLPIENTKDVEGIIELPAGQCVCTYHTGDYGSIGIAYERILAHCGQNGLKIISDSYEFAINDYLSTGDESEYITKIMFYVEKENNREAGKDAE